MIAACRRAEACFSVTAKMDPKIKTAIAAISMRTGRRSDTPNAIFDAQVAETTYTALASKKGQAVTARLIVRRVSG